MQQRLNPDSPRVVEIRTDVPSSWNGWRIAPERLAGLLWRGCHGASTCRPEIAPRGRETG